LPDEMHCLQRIIEPTIGIFTNIGEAHNEGFLNVRQKVNEKLKLFLHSDLLIYCADNPDVNEGVATFANQVRTDKKLELFSWSKKSAATLQIILIKQISGNTII